MTDRKKYFQCMERAHLALAEAYEFDPYIMDEGFRAGLIETYTRLAREAKKSAETNAEDWP